MINARDFQRGQFTYTTPARGRVTVPIDFNPAALDYSITLNAQGEGGQTQQVAGAASAKLNLELLFDTTDSGDDVRSKTHLVELMLRPSPPAGTADGPPPAPPAVTFEWGAFKFTGVVDSFKQTMDFFSANGVPLRAVVALSMSQPNYQFDQAAGDTRANVDPTLVLSGGAPFELALEAGNPFGARAIANLNGLESLRASVSGSVAIGGSVSIGAAAGFSAGVGASAGAGLGLGAGVSVGASAGAGAAASAGVAAGAGAFSGLHTSAPGSTNTFVAPQRLLATTSAPGVAPGALFDVTGRALTPGASTFRAEVGATPRLRFDAS